MLTNLFIRGLIIGFSIAAPVGPIGVLCIRRTLVQGVFVGICSGLGAAVADALFGLIAGLGIVAVSDFLVQYAMHLRVIGGLFLAYLGIMTLLSKPAKEAAQIHGDGIMRAFMSTFFLTLTNPMTILSFAAILAGAGVVSAAGDTNAVLMLVGGVFAGSAAWWLLLCLSAGLLRGWMNKTVLGFVNKLSGVIIIAFACWMLGEVVMKMMGW